MCICNSVTLITPPFSINLLLGIFLLLQATDSMKDQTLQSIDDSAVSAAEFLGGFDEKQRACLRAYAESRGIIQWIKKETKGSVNN